MLVLIATLQAPTVKVESGVLRGTLEDGLRIFRGVPYAQPPVGDLRWREPRPVKGWKDVRDATSFGPRPMQRPIYSDMMFRSPSVDEDCLTLNVWTPARGEKLPVLVYFYGGGFQAGAADEKRYDGASMAGRGIVSITVNYRLGAFGFLAHPALSRESGHGSGNYGLMDQAAALAWVRKNAKAFGGDPKRVTIAGESAGSFSVCAQMASPLAKGLFAGAIGESGAIVGARRPATLAEGEANGLRFAAGMSLKELRAIPADRLLDLAKGASFGPVVDGRFLTKDPTLTFEAGEQAKVPLLAGWNAAESGPGGVLGDAPATRDGFVGVLRKLYGDRVVEALRAYPVASDEGAIQAATDLASDRFIGYGTWKWTELQARTGGKPVYRYFYVQPRPGGGGGPFGGDRVRPGQPRAQSPLRLDRRRPRDLEGDAGVLRELRQDGRPERRGPTRLAQASDRLDDASRSPAAGRSGVAERAVRVLGFGGGGRTVTLSDSLGLLLHGVPVRHVPRRHEGIRRLPFDVLHGGLGIVGDLHQGEIVQAGGVGELGPVDLLDGVRRLVVVGVEAVEEEGDGNALGGEVVVVAAGVDVLGVVLEPEPDVLVHLLNAPVEARGDPLGADEADRVDVLLALVHAALVAVLQRRRSRDRPYPSGVRRPSCRGAPGGWSTRYLEPRRPISSPKKVMKTTERLGLTGFAATAWATRSTAVEPGAVVVRTGVDDAVGGDSEVVEVSADADVLGLEGRVASLDHADDVRDLDLFDGAFRGEVGVALEIEGGDAAARSGGEGLSALPEPSDRAAGDPSAHAGRAAGGRFAHRGAGDERSDPIGDGEERLDVRPSELARDRRPTFGKEGDDDLAAQRLETGGVEPVGRAPRGGGRRRRWRRCRRRWGSGRRRRSRGGRRSRW